MRSPENLHENITSTIRTLEALHADARALAEGSGAHTARAGLVRALDQARTTLAAALYSAVGQGEGNCDLARALD